MRKLWLVALSIGAIVVVVATHAHAKNDKDKREDLAVVPSVDLERYAGRWYEIARLPNRFEKDCAGDVTATYTLLKNGKIKVVNECRKANGKTQRAVGEARRASQKEPNSKLEVRFAPSFLSFLPFVWGDYWILDLAPDYSYAVVGDKSRNYFWILARTKQLDDATLERLTRQAAAQGFDTSKLIKTLQQN